MSNIIKIIMRDAKSISTNVVATVIFMGLCVIPSLYAWFNINSNWDPYSEEATSNLQIAVYSEDKGIKIGNAELVIGDSVVDALHNNTSIGWVFPENERTTINGVYSGEYYAALVIPEDFSQSIANIVDGDYSGGRIKYYSNEKKNAIGTKITGKAKNAVQSQVNSTVFKTITEIAAKAGNAAKSINSAGDDNSVGIHLANLKKDIDKYSLIAEDMAGTADSAVKMMNNVTKLNNKIVDDLQKDLGRVTTGTMSFSTAGIETANVRLQDYLSLLKKGKADIKRTTKLLKNISERVEEIETQIYGIADSETFTQLVDILQNEPEKIGTFFSTPVNLKTEKVYPIKNYGSAMAPFYTVLAIWFGALILVAIIHTKVHHFEGLTDVKHYQEYFGRYVIYFVIGQIQTLICVLGDLFFIQIQCKHMFLFWLTGALSSFVFTFFIYSLAYALGNVGEALAVIIMVIQVAGAGGTFPKEVLPDIYQMLYKFLPFTYSMDGFKEAVGGMYNHVYREYLLGLAAFLPVSLFIGLVVSIPFRKLNKIIERSKEKTKLMI